MPSCLVVYRRAGPVRRGTIHLMGRVSVRRQYGEDAHAGRIAEQAERLGERADLSRADECRADALDPGRVGDEDLTGVGVGCLGRRVLDGGVSCH